jgi:hypothetical protein
MERIASVRAVGRGHLEMIHELAIQQQVKVGGIPFHRPNVEGIGPGVTAQIGNGLGRERPFGISVERVSKVGSDLAGTTFHDVNLAAGRPANQGPGALHPEGWPASALSINARAQLELAVFELVQVARGEAGRRIINPFAALFPAGTAGDVIWIALMFRARLEDEEPIGAIGVFRLVPLQFLMWVIVGPWL